MNKIIVLCCLLLVPACSIFGKAHSLENILEELDRTIEHKQVYVRQKEASIDSLKRELAAAQSPERQYALLQKMFEEYNKFQMDSALAYVNRKAALLERYPSIGNPANLKMNRAEVFSIMGMYKEAVQTLDSIRYDDISASDTSLTNYYHQYRTVYGYLADFALTPAEKSNYTKKTNAYRDSLLIMSEKMGKPTYLLIAMDKQIVEHQYEKALSEVFNLYESPDVSYRLKGLLAYNIAQAYERLGQEEEYLYYLAVSAITDLRLCVREYVALPKLALQMNRRGETWRAYNYLHCSMRDAVACNARLRTIESSNIYPIINDAYKLQKEQSERIQTGLLMGITLLSAGLIFAIISIKKQIRRLAEARRALSDMNRQLSEANKELSELNLVKQQYLTYYLEQCTMYLDKLEDYRRSLAKLAITSKINELFKAIKSERFIEEERIKFYKSFDETFLKLYPHFVEQFNDLLADGEKIYPKAGELLCTEIRIFALIRLGISDSNKIARFLRYSINTIYIYRSKVRNKAKDNKASFEQQVMAIS